MDAGGRDVTTQSAAPRLALPSHQPAPKVGSVLCARNSASLEKLRKTENQGGVVLQRQTSARDAGRHIPGPGTALCPASEPTPAAVPGPAHTGFLAQLWPALAPAAAGTSMWRISLGPCLSLSILPSNEQMHHVKT